MVLQNRDGARACMPADEGHPDPSPRRMVLAGRHGHAAEPAGAIRLLHGPAAVVIESSQWMLLVMFIVVVLHDSLPALLRRLGWMMDKPKTASASLTSMVESHYGVSNLEVDWFGAAAGGVPPFDGLYSCRYDTGRRRNNGVLRVRNHRVWLYGPDGCEEERHGH